MRSKIYIFLLAVLLCLGGFFGYRYYHPSPQMTSSTESIEQIPVKLAKIDFILVEKQKRLMTLFHQQQPLRVYRIALGFSPVGPKDRQGDGKTPEGRYKIVAKNPNSRFHLSLKISYPSPEDRKKAKVQGISPGGEIMIHGLGKYQGFLGKKHLLRDWTLGCIALTNEEIEEIYPFISVGTPIEIKP